MARQGSTKEDAKSRVRRALVRKFFEIIGLASLIGVSAKADYVAEREALTRRVEAVRIVLQSQTADEVSPMQWFNWGNWPNWNNWPNWGNWGNWANY